MLSIFLTAVLVCVAGAQSPPSGASPPSEASLPSETSLPSKTLLQSQPLLPALVRPQVKFQVLKPKGVKVSVPGHDGLEVYFFEGVVNEPLQGKGIRQKQFFFLGGKPKIWTLVNKGLTISDGDVLHYRIVGKRDEKFFEDVGEFKYDGE